VIVDDQLDNLDVLALMLRDQFDVESCDSCPQALEAVLKTPPDLLLMDIAMADVDGVQCLHKIRALPGLAALPAIAVTAYAYPKDRDRLLSSGFQAFIAKPILDFQEVLHVIRQVLESI
jgi:CheY-like chemotaxis protein